jgi:nucleoside-diphosphate-sugar epimerase
VGTYALTKALGEEIARYYGVARKLEKVVKPEGGESAGPDHGLEVITLRIAGPLDLADPDLRGKPVRPQQVPVPDLAQAFCKALTVPLARYEVVTIVGASSHQLWDLEPARRVLGYEPEYRLDDLGVMLADPFAVEPI